MTIQLYDLCGADTDLRFSPHCWKTRLSFLHKGLDYETIPVPFTKVATIEDGDSRKVPVIRDGEKIVEDSYEIAKYLEAEYPDKPSLFNGAGGEALTAHIINWSQTQLHPAVAQLCVLDIHNELAPDDQVFFRTTREKLFGCTLEEFDKKSPKTRENLEKTLFPLELTLKKQKFIGGDTPLFADYVVFGGLQWLRTTCTHDVLPRDSKVADWFDTLLDMYDGAGRKAVCASSG